MKKKQMKGISHPMDDYRFFLEICTDTMTSTIEQLSLPFRSISTDHAKNWQNAFTGSLKSFGLLPMVFFSQPDEKISLLKKENNSRQNRIEQLETELNEKWVLLKGREEQIFKLKSELSSKKRENTLKKKKIESLSKQIADLNKLTKEAKPRDTSEKKKSSEGVASKRMAPRTVSP